MKALVIAEKPSVARDIARVLHCRKRNWTVEWKDGTTLSPGHWAIWWTLADPEAYDKKYVKWEMETFPMMPEQN